jgi:hypothetical protein
MKQNEIENALKMALEIIQKSQKKAGKKPVKEQKPIPKPKKPVEKQPEISYSEIPEILKDMKHEESITRFGFLYKSKTPYQDINSKSITKFYDDYNIKAYKR